MTYVLSCARMEECFNKWHHALFARETCQRPKPYPKAAPTLSCLYAFFFLQLTELNIVIKAICEEEKSQLSGPKEENPAHLDNNKPITANRLVTAIVLIGFFCRVFVLWWYFVLDRGALLRASILIVSYSVVFVAATPPFPILPHLSSLFVLMSSRQPFNLPPGLAGITTLRHCPPLPAALTPQTDQCKGSILHFRVTVVSFQKD